MATNETVSAEDDGLREAVGFRRDILTRVGRKAEYKWVMEATRVE